MPIIKSAIKKLRQDKKRREKNLIALKRMKRAVNAMRKNPSPKKLVDAFSELDSAVKKDVVHKNKASRLKSRLSKLVSSKKSSTK